MKITKEIVLTVKDYLSKDAYKKLSDIELGLLTGVSASTVSRVRTGFYDKLLVETKPLVEPVKSEDVMTVIPYDQLKHLLACEYAIEALLKLSILSTSIDNTLYISGKSYFGALKAYLPDDVHKRVAELKEGGGVKDE